MVILVLAGGKSNEREVSLRSGEAVSQALKSSGYEVILADPKDNIDLEQLANEADVAFLALHGAGGEDGSIQEKLELLDLPFVGTGSKSSRLCFSKKAYKELLLAEGLPASDGKVVTVDDIQSELFQRAYVLKPIEGGSSLDTQIVRHPDVSTLNAANDLLQKYPDMLLEPLVEGVEITVGILGDEALPIIEIIPPEGSEFDYENKYNGSTQEICPPLHVSESQQHEAKLLAERIHQITGCRQLSRTDIIIDKSGGFHVLETNTIPGFTDQSLYPKMARESGLEMPNLVDLLVKQATS